MYVCVCVYIYICIDTGEGERDSLFFKISSRDFPGGPMVKNLPANAGDTGSIPGLGRSHMPSSN